MGEIVISSRCIQYTERNEETIIDQTRPDQTSMNVSHETFNPPFYVNLAIF